MENGHRKRRSGVWYNVGIFFRLQAFLLPYKGQLALVYLTLLASTLFILLIPGFVGVAVDIVDPSEDGPRRLLGIVPLPASGDLQALFFLAGAVVAAAIFRGVASYGQSYFSQAISQRLAFDVRNSLYRTRKRFKDLVIERVRATVSSDTEAIQEMAELFAHL